MSRAISASRQIWELEKIVEWKKKKKEEAKRNTEESTSGRVGQRPFDTEGTHSR